jgi:hypothetical protein
MSCFSELGTILPYKDQTLSVETDSDSRSQISNPSERQIHPRQKAPHHEFQDIRYAAEQHPPSCTHLSRGLRSQDYCASLSKTKNSGWGPSRTTSSVEKMRRNGLTGSGRSYSNRHRHLHNRRKRVRSFSQLWQPAGNQPPPDVEHHNYLRPT